MYSAQILIYAVPADLVLIELVTVLLVSLTNTAVTLTLQLLLPALREEMVCVVDVPSLTVFDDVCCEPQKF